MIVQYTVVTAKTHLLLIERVNERIKDGWTPQGGVEVIVADRGLVTTITFCQAMVLEPQL